MVLISLEGIELERLQALRRPVEERAAIGDLLEKEWVGPIEDRDIHLSIRHQRLKVRDQIGVRTQRLGFMFEEHRKIHVACPMQQPGY